MLDLDLVRDAINAEVENLLPPNAHKAEEKVYSALTLIALCLYFQTRTATIPVPARVSGQLEETE